MPGAPGRVEAGGSVHTSGSMGVAPTVVVRNPFPALRSVSGYARTLIHLVWVRLRTVPSIGHVLPCPLGGAGLLVGFELDQHVLDDVDRALPERGDRAEAVGSAHEYLERAATAADPLQVVRDRFARLARRQRADQPVVLCDIELREVAARHRLDPAGTTMIEFWCARSFSIGPITIGGFPATKMSVTVVLSEVFLTWTDT